MFATPAFNLPVTLRRVGWITMACASLVLSACGGGDRASEYEPASIVSFGDESSAFVSGSGDFAAIKGGRTASESAAQVRAVLSGEPGAKLDMVLLNAGTALMAAGKADSIAAGIAVAREVVTSGAALNTLERLIRFSKS